MPKYKIAVIELLLKNNKTAKYGELVDEAEFNSPAADLKLRGYIATPTKKDLEAIAEAEKEKKAKEKNAKAAEKEAEEAAEKAAEAAEKAAEEAAKEAEAEAEAEAARIAAEEAKK